MKHIKDLEDKIEHIMKHFDFERVEKTMEALDWKWGMDGLGDGINRPSIQQLKAKARRLLFTVAQEGHKLVSSGGFMAEHLGDGLHLFFCVEDFDSEFYQEEDEV